MLIISEEIFRDVQPEEGRYQRRSESYVQIPHGLLQNGKFSLILLCCYSGDRTESEMIRGRVWA